MVTLAEIEPYTIDAWCEDKRREKNGEVLLCPNCGESNWFHPVEAPLKDGTTWKYRACKMCGFWQKADLSKAYRCVMTSHVCSATLPHNESCSYCGAWGPIRWHPCWLILPRPELDVTSCANCATVLGQEHVIPWPRIVS